MFFGAGYLKPQVMGDIPHDDPEDAASQPVLIGGRADSSTPAAVASGDRVRAWFSPEGAIKTSSFGTTTISGSVSITGSIPAGNNNIGDVDVVSLPSGSLAAVSAKTLDYDTGGGTDSVPCFGVLLPASGGAVAGGTASNPLRIDPTGTTRQPVDLISGQVGVAGGSGASGATTLRVIHASDDSAVVSLGTLDDIVASGRAQVNPIVGQAGIAAGSGASGTTTTRVVTSTDSTITVSGLPANTTAAATTVAHGAADSGHPLKIGGKVLTANPTAEAANDRVDAWFDKLGKQVVVMGCVRELDTDQRTTITSSTSETTVLTAGGAGVFHDLTGVLVSNTSGTLVRVDFRRATGGSVVFELEAPAGMTVGYSPLKPVRQASANNNWTAQSSGSVSDLRIFVQAEKNL